MFDLIREKTPENAKNDLLSGLTVALALVPEAVAFALVAQVNPLMGLYAAFMMGLITAAFGGRPGMISGATGAIAVVVAALAIEHGPEYLLMAVVLMGLIQIVFGALKLGKFIRLVPHPVFLGFVNGLALVIFLAQMQHFQTPIIGADGTAQLLPNGQKAMEWLSFGPLFIMFLLIGLTMAIIQFLPNYTTMIPSTLAAILLGSLIAILLALDTRTVGDMASIKGGLPLFHFPNVPFSLETLKIILPYSFIMAMVGLIESLLTLNLVDEMTETRGQPNREAMAQGAANTITGVFGGMGGCAMVGQSMINIKSGGRGRLSGISAALFLLSFILVGSSLIEQIPIAVLVGVMFMVVIGTFEWGTFQLWGKIPLADMLIVGLVTIVTVFSDLAVAVIVGVIVSALVFAWQHAKEIYATTSTNKMGGKVYSISGPIFFASVLNFQELFDPANDPDDVVVDFKNSRVVDHSAIEAIDKLADRYLQRGKRLHLKHLSPECRALLKKAGPLVEVNVVEDPNYHVVVDGEEFQKS